jgi:hypothetical protein
MTLTHGDADRRQRAERQRQETARRVYDEARRRLRRMEQAALARPTLDGPRMDPDRVILDSERYAAPLSERLGARGRVQLLLWGLLLIVGAFALVSFFSEPLMSLDTAVSAVLVTAMLILSYLV